MQRLLRATRNLLDCVIVFLVLFFFWGEFQLWRGCDEDDGGVRAPSQTFTLQQSDMKGWKWRNGNGNGKKWVTLFPISVIFGDEFFRTEIVEKFLFLFVLA